MNYHLFYAPGAASMAVHWMLIELDVPFEAFLVDIDRGEQRDPQYLKLNPSGRVPTLVIDGVAYGETVALMMLLAERHPGSGLVPDVGSPQRAEWLQLAIYIANTLMPAMRDWLYAAKDGNPEGADAVKALAEKRICSVWDDFEARLLKKGDYLLGDHFGMVDMLAVMLMRWSRNMPCPAIDRPTLRQYVDRIAQRDSYIELNTREGLSGWPA
ncbi:MAG: glutathione S-transferase family protein [Thalassospira sp.]|jgi:glutathione S-transferase|uniref:glutathione S-transferase family protein n=1 Tax=Thalassospira sp. TaxID=1912094 RepID=UPI001B29455D|nr:glutathione S-transferase family protein [Thalassospira sp.]MBO6577741.1 glutathione S-transferase family protein [Thalassospira sp.]MBO6804124.1 glutathione S-transferase family protein [Thalassospira sp.]MBO6818601.1 glutathione S-transferase family protein [Thalassospira sp.]MBO6887465.1 glutathione S-transferase family protein [Thalassospira sp.]